VNVLLREVWRHEGYDGTPFLVKEFNKVVDDHYEEIAARIIDDDTPGESHVRVTIEDLTTRWKYRLTIVDPFAKPESMWLNPRYVIVSQAAFDVVETTKLLHDGEHVADVVMTRAGYPVEVIGKIERMPDFDWEEVSL
jgi:hypothetical protein